MDHHHYNAHRAGLVAPELAHHDVVDLAPLGAPGAAAAVVTSTSDNAHLAVGAVEGQRTTGRLIFDQHADDCKRFATLRARLEPAGWGLIRTYNSDGAPIYFATRWNMPRELACLSAVEAFADRVRAPR